METMSVMRALIELKTLDKRISKKIGEFYPVIGKAGKHLSIDMFSSESEFVDITRKDFQSIKDLIARRFKIKAAILKSNSEAKVTINGVEMTVAEAIDRKTSIVIEKDFLSRSMAVFGDEVRKMEIYNASVKERLDKLLLATFSKDSSKVKPDEYDAVAKPFMQSNEAILLDPLDVKSMAGKMEDDISMFEQEVNVVLSESNAVREIHI